MKKFIITALSVLLCGCQLNLSPHRDNPEHARSVTQPPKPSLQLMQLWTEGTLDADSPVPVAFIRADSDRVTFSWNGDAVELLNALARARGQVFSYAGVRLPLPVDIEVQGVTYANVLRIIQMQTAWRATLETYPGQMMLQFMSSIPAEPAHYKKGDKR
ncbi:DotD/TraH family lipoprotein [Pectobacterium parvum]|uniref:DotD/TraH family lipoprotein n=1 Tax=Pectobacterium parvum TaxID=2778550 RepID=UPI000DC64253|nr:DotD/TraH family lipoprotein [Pectobacterium parvum]